MIRAVGAIGDVFLMVGGSENSHFEWFWSF